MRNAERRTEKVVHSGIELMWSRVPAHYPENRSRLSLPGHLLRRAPRGPLVLSRDPAACGIFYDRYWATNDCLPLRPGTILLEDKSSAGNGKTISRPNPSSSGGRPIMAWTSHARSSFSLSRSTPDLRLYVLHVPFSLKAHSWSERETKRWSPCHG